jgi:hypothetical protein
MKRTTLIIPAALLLAGCVDGSASYYVDGRDHALTVRAEQAYFWSDEVTLKLVAAHLPECQRQHALGNMPLGDLEVELYASGENVFTVRAGKESWQVETQSCNRVAHPAQEAPGERLGTFRLNADKKLVFDKAGAA